jgi:hypothetical protein
MPFAGVPYGDVSVSTNGWASFGEPGADYWNDYQPDDFRGLEFNVGEYTRGVMPFWLDGDLEECCNPDPQERGPGEVRVVNPGDGRLAVQWEVNSHEEGDTPRREMQALLFSDGRIRYDYDAPATSPDSDDDAFVGLSPGTGEDVLDVIAPQTRTTPGSSYLYTPRPVSSTGAPAGKVSVTLPFGSTFDSADSGCSLVKAPTGREDGLVECDTPEIAGGGGAVKQVRFVMPDRNINTGSVANVAYEATWQVGDEELTDEEELVPVDGYRDSEANLTIDYTGPAGQGTGAPLEFTVAGTFTDTAREPVVTIDIPEGFELQSTTLPDCSDAPSGFGGGRIECVLSSGTQSFTRTVTFEAEANGTYEVEGELVADNADADTDTAGLTVPVP